MDHGRIVQFGEPRTIYFRPENEFVASFIGAANLLNGTTVAAVQTGGIGRLRLDDGAELSCLFPSGSTAGHAATASVRPESIAIAPAGAAAANGANVLRGAVTAASFLGASVRYDVRVGERMLRVVGSAELVFPPGTDVLLVFPPQATVSV
jgi:ABC-type Fe3+/spermidine/putrescine transport system ATPase subunit